MSVQDTELDETNSETVAPGHHAKVTVKLERPDDAETEQGFRRIFHEQPVGANAAAFLLAAAVIAGGGLLVRNTLVWESTDDAQVNGHIMPLSARINGYVLDVPVIEGQLVHAGDVLLTIDPNDYKIAVEQAQATFADALLHVMHNPLDSTDRRGFGK
jgi:hypothetical protein